MIDAPPLIDRLERFGQCITSVVAIVTLDDARWKPADGAWSVLEIVHHLLDEETGDFRARLRSTLQAPSQPWPPIDPEGWAVQRRYNDADLTDVLARFVTERRNTVAWLRDRVTSDWSTAYEYPQYGPIRAGDLLAAWAAHDALHLRQIAKRLHQLAQRDAEGYSIIYAGEWRA